VKAIEACRRSGENDHGNIAEVNMHIGLAEMYSCQTFGNRLIAAFNARLSFLTTRARRFAKLGAEKSWPIPANLL
jgi:hypothetical protein